jgi:flavodoxin
MKALVLYYSRTGVTRHVAELIAKELGADIEEIHEEKDRSGAMGYMIAGKDAAMKKTAEITTLKHKLMDYDTIAIGQPVWAWTMVPAIRALLTKYSLRKKKVLLFATQDGSGADGAFRETRKLLLGSEIVAEAAFTKAKKDPELDKKVKAFVSHIFG